MIYLDIFLAFFKMSFISFGGMFGVLPELQNVVVNQHHWLTSQAFVDAYVIGQFVPGPNMAMTGVVGYWTAGILGWFAALCGIYLGPLITMRIGSHYFEKHRGHETLKRFELAIRPLVLGLITTSFLKFFVMQARSAPVGALLISGALLYLYVTKRISAIVAILLSGPLWLLWSFV